MTDVGSARVEVTGDVRNFARTTMRELDRVLSGMPDPTINVDVDVDKKRTATAFAAAGAEAATVMTGTVAKGMSGLGSAFSASPYVAAAGVALALAIGAAAAPALGAALVGALVGGGGLAALAGGIALVANRPEIKKAAQSIKDRFLDIDTSDLETQILAARDRLDKARKSKNKTAIAEARADLKTLEGELNKAQAFNAKNFSLRDAAAPLIKPLLSALQTFVEAAKPIIKSLGDTFQTLADSGAIEAIATGLVGLVTAALPGFNALIDAAGPFLVMLGGQLPVIGAALGEFFRVISTGAPGATVFFQDLVQWVGTTIIAIATIISWLSNAYITVRKFFTDAGAWIQGAIAWFAQFGASVVAFISPIIPVFQGVWRVVSSIVTTAWKVITIAVQTGAAIIRGIIAAVSAAIRGDWQGTWNAMKSIVSAVLNGIRGTISAVMSGIRGVVIGAVQAIRASWSAGWNGLVSTTTSAISRVRGVISGLRATVQGAFASAASWLVSAGGKIISGFISGIQSQFGRVRSVLSALTGMLPDWKGPARVDEEILRDSGRKVMEGFEGGLTDQFGSIRRALNGVTADLPSFTGSVRGGDGASGTDPGGRGMNVTIMPGAVVIQGGGAQAGNEAAEALLEALANAQD